MAGSLTISTLKDSSGVLATQNGMTGIAKAWVNYNGSAQTVTGSFNVSSVTYVSTGNYTVNFTTAMPNANYCAVVGATYTSTGGSNFNYGVDSATYSTTQLKVVYLTSNGAAFANKTIFNVAVLGN
jgi:hypothetical protein